MQTIARSADSPSFRVPDDFDEVPVAFDGDEVREPAFLADGTPTAVYHDKRELLHSVWQVDPELAAKLQGHTEVPRAVLVALTEFREFCQCGGGWGGYDSGNIDYSKLEDAAETIHDWLEQRKAEAQIAALAAVRYAASARRHRLNRPVHRRQPGQRQRRHRVVRTVTATRTTGDPDPEPAPRRRASCLLGGAS